MRGISGLAIGAQAGIKIWLSGQGFEPNVASQITPAKTLSRKPRGLDSHSVTRTSRKSSSSPQASLLFLARSLMMGTSINHPYFSPDELSFLSERHRGKMSETHETKARTQACSFIEVVSKKIGFPRATIATAQTLFHRFYLFFSWRDFNNPLEVALAALYVSSKMHDTLKKPRDLIMVSYVFRYPEYAAKAKHGGEIDIDPAILDSERRRLLSLERLVMETVSFNFCVRMPFSYVIKVARSLRASKFLGKLAWRLAIDSHRTTAPLMFPPHVIAIASLYLAAKLDSFDGSSVVTSPGDRTSQELADLLETQGSWEREFHTNIVDLNEICHLILDMLLTAASSISSHPVNTSPNTPQTPASPSPNATLTPSNSNSSLQETSLFSTDTLTRLKIHLRQREQPGERAVKPRIRGTIPGRDTTLFYHENAPGRNGANESEGTVRFLFGPDMPE